MSAEKVNVEKGLDEKVEASGSDSKSVKSGINVESEAQLESPEVEHGEETLHRGLKARQISMIALGGAVGTGLIIGSGVALQRGGPLGILIGYSFVGWVCYLVMVSLGEMSAYLPHKKGFAGYSTRFVDPALGYALGWNYLLKYLVVTPNNINAAGIVIQYWTNRADSAVRVDPAIWMIVFIAFIFIINLLGVRVFGELEFWFSSIKVLALIGLILMSLIIDAGGNPQHEWIGFRYWDPPDGPMGTYLQDQVGGEGPLSRFLGFWAVMVNGLFAYMGTELIGVTVGEAENPRRNIPIAIRRTFFRILVFYVGGVFCIGLIVPSQSASLLSATKAGTNAGASPFVVATNLVGIQTLDSVINAAILVFVLSAANSDLYIGSRTLYGLALEGKAPRIFRRVNRMGVPYTSLILCTAFCFLVYLNVSSGSKQVFTYFVNLVSTFGALTWLSITYTHIRFMKALAAQGISRDSLPYKAPFQPWGAWMAFVSTGVIMFFKGFDAFIPWKVDTFLTSYIGVPVFFFFWIFWRLRFKTHMIPLEKVDLISGKKEIDDEEERFLAEQALLGPRTLWQKIWDGL